MKIITESELTDFLHTNNIDCITAYEKDMASFLASNNVDIAPIQAASDSYAEIPQFMDSKEETVAETLVEEAVTPTPVLLTVAEATAIPLIKDNVSEITRKRISESLLGKKKSALHRKHISEGRKKLLYKQRCRKDG